MQLLVGLASRCSEMFKSEHVALLLSAYSATRSKCGEHNNTIISFLKADAIGRDYRTFH